MGVQLCFSDRVPQEMSVTGHRATRQRPVIVDKRRRRLKMVSFVSADPQLLIRLDRPVTCQVPHLSCLGSAAEYCRYAPLTSMVRSDITSLLARSLLELHRLNVERMPRKMIHDGIMNTQTLGPGHFQLIILGPAQLANATTSLAGFLQHVWQTQ